MTPSKWLLSFGLLLVVGGGVWVLISRSPEKIAAPATPQTPPAKASSEVETFKAAPAVRRVQEFYARESERIGAVDPDPRLTEARLQAVAAELNPDEIKWLEGEASGGRTGDGRFFATYLLALSSGPEALSSLARLALSPLPTTKNQARAELERQIRAQAVEGLGRACGRAPAAKDDLLDVVEKQNDEFLRDRAHRALYQCDSGKSVESQDKAALEKVLYGK